MSKQPPSQGKGSKNRSTKKYQEHFDGIFRKSTYDILMDVAETVVPSHHKR